MLKIKFNSKGKHIIWFNWF